MIESGVSFVASFQHDENACQHTCEISVDVGVPSAEHCIAFRFEKSRAALNSKPFTIVAMHHTINLNG
jgi:hypothetical protein